MSYEVKFTTTRSAMNHACFYNKRAVKIILTNAKRAAKAGTPFNRQTFNFMFSFGGIQGYPVACFHARAVQKGYATPYIS